MYARILVPIDGSETSKLGLREAIKIAKNQGSHLVLFHIVNEFLLGYTYSPELYANQLLDSLRAHGEQVLHEAAALAELEGLHTSSILEESIGGVAGDLIIQQAGRASVDLIVMGTHGRRGIRRLALGSDAENVVRGASVPVLLIRDQSVSAQGMRHRSAA
jgi:nucleotide-binding universal stress UspA family protein